MGVEVPEGPDGPDGGAFVVVLVVEVEGRDELECICAMARDRGARDVGRDVPPPRIASSRGAARSSGVRAVRGGANDGWCRATRRSLGGREGKSASIL